MKKLLQFLLFRLGFFVPLCNIFIGEVYTLHYLSPLLSLISCLKFEPVDFLLVGQHPHIYSPLDLPHIYIDASSTRDVSSNTVSSCWSRAVVFLQIGVLKIDRNRIV